MHILFFTDNFPPESNAPAIRTFDHSKEWVKQGHSVTVITCAPNFPEGILYPGYKNAWYQKENMEGIDVIRVKTYMTANEGVAKRTLDYMSFMFTSFFVGLFVKKVDVVVGTSPQFFCACSGFVVAKLKRRPFVFELRDFWPDSIKAVGAINRPHVIRLFEKIEQYLYKKSSLIVPVTNSFEKTLNTRGIESTKICVVKNGVDLDKFYPRKKDLELEKKFKLKGKFVIGYIGTHGLAHSLITVVEAAEKLQHRKDVVFIFVGSGAAKKKLLEVVAKKHLENVQFVDRQDQGQIARYWSLCDLSIVHLRNLVVFKDVIPSKIFESMAMGIPIILGQPAGEATQLVELSESGIVIPPESPEQMALNIEKLVDNLKLTKDYGVNAEKFAKQFDRKKSAHKMLNKMKSL